MPLTVVERLPDGRLLVASDERPGVLFVSGEANQEPAAARMGYRRTRTPVRPRPARRAVVPGLSAAARAAAAAIEEQVALPEQRAQELFLSLLDAGQREQWARYRQCWVDTPRGPVRLGHMHDLRFRPNHAPGEEWSLCVVPSGPPLPRSDVWSNLLLVLAADPDTFFRVANVRGRGLTLSPPHPGG